MEDCKLLDVVKPFVLMALRPNAPELTDEEIVPELNIRDVGDEISSVQIIMHLEDRFGVEFSGCDPDSVLLVRDAMNLARTAMATQEPIAADLPLFPDCDAPYLPTTLPPADAPDASFWRGVGLSTRRT